ncbi:PAS domain-containing sensor histidine kinase [Parabacteroides sp. 52]|uniref:hybrid sensor histidine kinase/response regulator n=1 Tax=Parabacteroides sp. 52 TaxID=2302940 RepID=UPI0013D27D29|nr:PAS domain-containing hybrid sensor histidine kinase/response regulator [Parabacteroides sp. 52]MDH6534210.1 signal transduction histidine kinase/CheY-like chemotaxis protein/PAS domain-containing protein [Parabacteroides sp. PM5-20]NDV55405.1 PAS domain-containing sensor histidine kinase [Parabacteroides sp. 52]
MRPERQIRYRHHFLLCVFCIATVFLGVSCSERRDTSDPLIFQVPIVFSAVDYYDPVFAWMQGGRCGIENTGLPSNATILHKPFGGRYKKHLIGSSFFVSLLLITLISFFVFLYIREKKKRALTQNELQGHRNKLKIVLSSIREGVVSVDLDRNVFAINPSALGWLHLNGNEEDYIGKSIEALIDIPDICQVNTLRELIMIVFEEMKSVPLHTVHMVSLLGNHSFPIAGSVSAISRDGQLYGAVIVFHDISEELAQNEYLELTLGAGDVVSWRFDNVNRNILFDPSFFEKYKVQGDAYHGISYDVIKKSIHPEDRQGWLDANDQLKSEKVDKLVFPMRVYFEGKGYQWLELRYTSLKSLSPESPPLIFGLVRNIEDFKQTLFAIEQARDKAAMSDKLKSAFLANMSHEIRTPLNAIVGFSNVLTSGENFETEERQIFIEMIRNNCNLLLALISDVLDLAQIESGSILFKEEVCDLNELISQIIITQQVIIPEHLSLVRDVPSETVFIMTDKLRLNQVITNLINNAVKFTNEGRVTVGYTQVDERYIHLFVEDTGRGIPEKDLNNIFERFFKKDDFKQGAGLGLSICKMIVDRYKGTIEVTSQEGKGSRFTVILPYLKATPVESTPSIFTNSKTYKLYNMNMETNNTPMQERPTLLIAEDEESNYLLLKTILQKHCHLFRAKTGVEALKIFNENAVDLIMLDIKMPEMTGIEALKEIRKISTTIPIIMQSAYVFDSDMESARQAGASDFITKPINLKLLKETISRYLPSLNW